jgi:D-alanine transaminase
MVQWPYAPPVLAYVNGQIMAPSEARVSPFDRGFVFADGVYEVLRVTRLGAGAGGGAGGGGAAGGGGRLVAQRRHEARMTRSLAQLGIEWDVRDPATGLAAIGRRLAAEAALNEALIYVQVTRGTPDLSAPPLRSHVPPTNLTPTVFAFIRALPALTPASPMASKACWTVTDQRWLRCDIKSIALLGNVMASMEAQRRHDDPSTATEAILLRDTPRGRLVSEGSLTNLAIVTSEGRLLTPDASSVSLLPGITREILLAHEASNPHGLRTGDITEADLRAAREVMLLGTTASVTRVTHIDGRAVGAGGEAGAKVSERHAARLSGLLLGLLATGSEDGGGDR